MINQKGELAQSTEEIKTKAKQDLAAPADYNKMIFQLKAFAALIEILFGKVSIASKQVGKFIHLIEVNSISYKGCTALDDSFPSKVLWSVCTRFQLFLDNCTHTEEREDVDDSLINFLVEHRDIILDRFGATLLPSFTEVTNKDPDTKMDKGKKTKKQKSEETKEKKKEQQGGATKNENQCMDFKMKEGEQWSTFAGASLADQAKLNGTFMCGHWHTQGHCFFGL
jgi:hypothetical protein